MPFLTLVIGIILGAALAGLLLASRRRAAGPGRLREALERCAMGAILMRDRKVVWANARSAAILGVDAGALPGADSRAYHQDDAAFERFGRTVKEICERDGAFRGDIRLRRVDGSPFWAYLAGGPLVPGHPEEGLLWFLEDVTERVEAQLDLSEVLSLNQKLIAASPNGILLYRAADGACVLANEAAARILSGSPEELLRENFRRLGSWKASGLREAAERALASGADEILEGHFTSDFGKEVWVVAHFVPFTSRGERLLLLLADDISVRKRVEGERERLLGELEQKNKELETLLYVASHDLRSPLVNIQGFSQRLARSLEELRKAQEGAASLEDFAAAARPHLQERMPSSLEFIRASGIRMDAIINGLLTLSRAGRMELRTGPLDMNAVLASCSATLAFQFQSVEGLLLVDDLPPCRADAVQVTQIVSNLLDNAIKYRHGERPLRVRVSGRVEGAVCEYCVEDNGVGISAEHRERIWEIFQRLDPLGPIPGDGLGLTLVRRMAERNGGGVRVESVPGEGSRFHVELPRGPG